MQEAGSEQGTTLARRPQEALATKLDHLQETLMEANARAVTFVRRNPLPVLAGALVVGYLIGRAASRHWLR